MSRYKEIPFIKIRFTINLVMNIQFETWSQKTYFKIVKMKQYEQTDQSNFEL
jgi:hypothetical protein